MVSFWSIIWLGIAIIAAVTEGITVQLISIWFAISGAITALVVLFVPLDFAGQLLLFSILGLLMLVITRPLIKKKLLVRKECTNADMVIGKIGKMVIDIEDELTPGRVLVTGMDWSAKSIDGQPIKRDTMVRICAIEGVTLVVKPDAK